MATPAGGNTDTMAEGVHAQMLEQQHQVQAADVCRRINEQLATDGGASGTAGAPAPGSPPLDSGSHFPVDGDDDPENGDDADYVLLNDDVLTSVSNSTLVLVDGSDLERMAVLYQFPQFLEHCPDETLTIMVPEISEFAVSWKHNVQMAAAEALYFVVNMAVPEDVAKRIVYAALRIIQASESGEVFDAWGEILSMMLPQVRRADVQTLVVPATIARASSATVESRRLAARVIGSLNDTLTASELHEKFLAHALVLCDDPDASVRAMIAQSLAALGAKLPLRVSEVDLWPKLQRLMQDANPRVRAAAMRAVAKTAEAHAKHCKVSPSFRKLLLPIFLRECETAYEVAGTDLRTVSDDTYLMLEIFSEVYGYFLCAVSELFENNDVWTEALNSLRRMVTCNGPTVRHWCAFNIPAVAQVCARSRPEKIQGVIQALSSDTDVETRATLAAGIHETTRLVADGPLRDELLSAIAMLMTDQNPQVRMNSLRHFSAILTMLSETGPLSTEEGRKSAGKKSESEGDASQGSTKSGKSKKSVSLSTTSGASGQLYPIVSSLETMSHDSWRTQKLLAEQLQASAQLIPQEMLCAHIAPLLFSMARESTYLVRKASMSALVYVVRFIPDVRRRDHILKHFRSEWARGKVYWTRLAFIDAAEVALGVLSNKLFTQLFSGELFNLALDPVPNVRLRLGRLMPKIAVACGTRPGFLTALKTLLSDQDDNDVVLEARAAKKAIAVSPPLTFAEADEDAKKEAAEKQFFIQRQKRKSASATHAAGSAGAVNGAGVAGSKALANGMPVAGSTKPGTPVNGEKPKSGKSKRPSSGESSRPSNLPKETWPDDGSGNAKTDASASPTKSGSRKSKSGKSSAAAAAASGAAVGAAVGSAAVAAAGEPAKVPKPKRARPSNSTSSVTSVMTTDAEVDAPSADSLPEFSPPRTRGKSPSSSGRPPSPSTPSKLSDGAGGKREKESLTAALVRRASGGHPGESPVTPHARGGSGTESGPVEVVPMSDVADQMAQSMPKAEERRKEKSGGICGCCFGRE